MSFGRDRRLLALAALASAAIAAASCAVAQAPSQVQRPPAVSAAHPTLQTQVDTAIADLARRLGIDTSQITVVEARAVVWPDRSLGCPQPGLLYPQVLQDGFFIRLQAQGRTFPYHGGGSRGAFLCESAERREPPTPGSGGSAGSR